jgi:hypothetical protein
MGCDGDNGNNGLLQNRIDDVFFSPGCLVDNCFTGDVAVYMDYMSSELRLESIVGTELCLLMLFLLLQLGGIPNPRSSDGKSYTALGSLIWSVWMLFVFAQFAFTLFSILTAVLATVTEPVN